MPRLRQDFQQRGMDWFGSGREAVDRLHESEAHEVTPRAVHGRARELAVAVSDDLADERLPRRLLRARRGAVEESRRHGARAVGFHRHGRGEILVELGADPLERLARLRLDVPEVRRQPPEVLLRVGLGGMVMALGALQLEAEEDPGGAAGERNGRLLGIEVPEDEVDLGGLVLLPPRRDEGRGKAVVGEILPPGPGEPLVERGEVDLEGIGLLEPESEEEADPPVGEEAGGLVGGEHPVDGAGALAGRAVRGERPHLGGRREAPEDVERDAAEVLVVVCGSRGLDGGGFPVRLEVSVDEGRDGVGPFLR